MLNGEVNSADDQEINTLFGAKTPGADNLLGGTKKKEEQGLDDQDLTDDDQQEDDLIAQKKKVVDPAEAAREALRNKTSDEVVDELVGKKEEGTEDDAKGKEKPKAKVAGTPDLEVDYKAVYEQMVADGVFGEVEVPDDFVWDADGFKEVQNLQVKSQYDDLLDKTGPYGKAIIDYEKNGGNPGELLGLFREQRTIQEFDISAPEGQEEFLTSYYEAQNYSTKSIDRTIKALIDQGGDALKEEAEEKKTLWDAQYTEEVENKKKEQALVAAQMERDAKAFNKTISETLTTDGEVTPKERKELASYILNYDKKYNGHDVSQFYLDMTEIQKDPAAYVELAKFIKGLKTGDYKKKIADKTKREVNAKTFMRVKNSSALSTKNAGSMDVSEDEASSFVSLLSKKK